MRCGFALSGVATLLAVMVALVSCKNSRPNIIVIIADDMGNNDVSFHGSDEIPTPNIDALAYNGVILNSHYTQALCTPSRAAFLTGKYPIHLGMQHIVILEPEPSGLPLNETLFPQHLKRHGYKTHAVGKWHLGFYKKEYTPTYRGFDSHYGYWQGFHDYYDHTVCATYSPECGYDMRNNMTVDWDAQGKYSTTLFTNEAVRIIKEHNVEDPMFMYLAHLAPHTGNDAEPLQAPDEEIAKFSYIADPERRIYAAMISMLDQSVGRVITALREKRMLENSIILFISDNGAKTIGIHANHGSNYPLRGLKTSTWEGAMRNVAAVWSPLIKRPQRINNEVMHISDWMPTFYTAAGLNISELGKIDGVDMWRVISEGGNSPRQNFVYNIDDIWKYGAVRMGDYKYMYGSPVQGTEDRWFGSTGRDPNYKYTEEQILKSPAGVSFNGLTTHLQIKDVHSNKNSTITHTLLTAEKIKTLRKEATIDCLTPDDQKLPCNPITAPCLFNIKTDPCEKRNLASVLPSVFKKLETYYVEMRKGMRTPINTPIDPNADPVKWNGTWTNWMDAEEVYKMRISHQNLSPLAIGLITAACLAFFVIIVILFVISCKRSPKSKMNSIFAGLEDPMDSPAAAMNGRDREMRVVQIVNGRPHESH